MLFTSQVSACQNFRTSAPFFFLVKAPFFLNTERAWLYEVTVVTHIPNIYRFVGLALLFFFKGKSSTFGFFFIQKGV